MCLFTTRLFVLHNIKWLGKISHCQQRPSKRRHLQTLTHVVLEVGTRCGRPAAVPRYIYTGLIFGRAIALHIARELRNGRSLKNWWNKYKNHFMK